MGKSPTKFVSMRGDALISGSRYAQARIPAGIDIVEGCQIIRHVERHAVITAAAPYAKSKCGNFRAADIDTRRPGASPCKRSVRGQHIDHGLLEEANHCRDGNTTASEIDEAIDDRLPRTVIGDLPAAIDACERNQTATRKMFRATRYASRIDGVVFDNPQLVSC